MNFPDLTPILPWYERHKRDLPWRHTKDPYRIWVSEIMLQQTRVEAVIPYYERFLNALPTVAALAAAPEAQLLKLWEGLGYYSRVRNMQKAAKEIVERHNGVFPTTFAGILSLCGIGEYTAGAIASFAFDLPHPAVDGNVLRVAARLLSFEEDVLAPTSKKQLTAAVATAQPKDRAADFNQAMIELGATVCLPNGVPKCGECPLRDICRAHAAHKETALPIRRKPAPRKKYPKTVWILRCGDRIALRRRPSEGLLAGLFEPYCREGHQDEVDIAAALAEWGITPLRIAPLGEAKHIFTHLEWHMVGFEVIIPENGMDFVPAELFFVPREEIDVTHAIPSAYRAYRPFM